jgi:xylulokinase
VHAFCHAVPGTWHQMGVLLSAAASLAWWAAVSGRHEPELLNEIDPATITSPVWFAPYLSGERTPHNDTRVRGGFLGLAGDTTRAHLTLAVLEGVAYALKDAQQALTDSGTVMSEAALIGGGARSPLWAQIIADVLGISLHQVAESEIGCALGAARLARMAAGESIAIARPATRLRTFTPRSDRVERHALRHARWQRLYPMARDFAR